MSEFSELSIKGSWLFESPLHFDERGSFFSHFNSRKIHANLGRKFEVVHSSQSRSRKGVIRGIHFSLAHGGQAKWVTCAHGAIWDVIVDLRPKSPTFKHWLAVELRANEGKALLISEGLGHAFLSLEDDTVVSYLLTSEYSPQDEFTINPQDLEIGIPWPENSIILSQKDSTAPTLSEFLVNRQSYQP